MNHVPVWTSPFLGLHKKLLSKSISNLQLEWFLKFNRHGLGKANLRPYKYFVGLSFVAAMEAFFTRFWPSWLPIFQADVAKVLVLLQLE
jgi:hypothetical protein